LAARSIEREQIAGGKEKSKLSSVFMPVAEAK